MSTFSDHRTITWKTLVLLVLCSMLYTIFLVSFATNNSSSDVLINQAAFVATDFLIDDLTGQIFFNAMPQVTVSNICNFVHRLNLLYTYSHGCLYY
jgi:hypothetical protein